MNIYPERQKEITFSDYIPYFIEEKSITLSPVTIKNYSRELRRAEKTLGDHLLSSINSLEMKHYINNLQLSSVNQHTGKNLKHSTIVQHYIILHSFFTNAMENELLDTNPMMKIKRPKAPKSNIDEKECFYDAQRIRYILSCLEKEPLKWQAIVMFAIDSGCRCGEIMGLKWDDIDFKSGRVNICRNVQYTPERGPFICSTKNNKNRILLLNKPVLKLLKKWYNAVSADKKDNEFCFTKRNGSIMIPGTFNQYLRRFGKRYGLEGIHPHLFRHAMASISITNGADIVSVSKKLGHSKVSITLNIYSHTNEDALSKANGVFAKAVYI